MRLSQNVYYHKKSLRILSNINLPNELASSCTLEITHISNVLSLFDIICTYLRSFTYDAIVINCPTSRDFVFCALRLLLPFSKAKLIFTEDLILPKPIYTFIGTIKNILMSVLLKAVDLFIIHHIDTLALQKYYRIPIKKIRYVPFKINSYDAIMRTDTSHEEYILSAGKSMRDYNTFIKAMGMVNYPGVILTPDAKENIKFGTLMNMAEIPTNVQIIHDDNTDESWISAIAKAKVVVLTILPETIYGAGMGTYIVAMALRKCVIITDSPATRGILQDEINAIIIPPEDPFALKHAIRKVCENEGYRKKVAESGYRHVMTLGGTDTFYKNLAIEISKYIYAHNRL